MTETRVRVLLVDDEPLARETLRLLMADDATLDVVGECGSGREALQAIAQLAPDLVFLDVQMPELDGFQTLARLPAGRRPIVVFVTAYDRYAVKAFDAHALDYLVKPFTDARFHEALARAKTHVRQRAFGELGERVMSLLRTQGLDGESARTAAALPTEVSPAAAALTADAAPASAASASAPAPAAGSPPRALDRIAVKTNGRTTFVRVAEIDWIEACDDHIRLHVGRAAHELRQPMKSLAARLDARRFVRIHRSAIVNLDRVQELQPHFHGSYVVVLKSGVTLPLSRARREELREALGGLP